MRTSIALERILMESRIACALAYRLPSWVMDRVASDAAPIATGFIAFGAHLERFSGRFEAGPEHPEGVPTSDVGGRFQRLR